MLAFIMIMDYCQILFFISFCFEDFNFSKYTKGNTLKALPSEGIVVKHFSPAIKNYRV